MKAIVSQGQLNGEIKAPPSKSWTQRVLAGALLHKGKTIIHNCGKSDDERAALGVIETLGAEVKMNGKDVHIFSNGIVNAKTEVVSCGESGLSARLFLPIVALSNARITVTGNGSLLNRPMLEGLEAMKQMDVDVENSGGKLPITVNGPMAMPKTDIVTDGSTSSQFLTGMLYAVSAIAEKPVIIYVKGLNSRPYVDMTIKAMRSFGRAVYHERYERFTVMPYEQRDGEVIIQHIPGDWSNAAFWLVGAVITEGKVHVQDLQAGTAQADENALNILRQVGAIVQENGNGVSIQGCGCLKAFNADLNDAPDLFPILAVLAACCEGRSRLGGLNRLIHKESNRRKSIEDMLTTLGVIYEEQDDMLIIEGRKKLAGGRIEGCGDHRIVMAAAIAGLRAEGVVQITDAESAAKSYPHFFEDAATLGMRYRIE